MNERTRPNYGDTRISFHATAYGLGGKPINGGQLYADRWDSPDELRAWAAQLFRSPNYRVGHVDIDGRELEFAGDAWRATGKHRTFERVERDTPVELTPADERMTCYDTCVMDYPETVHERRSDNSCACGKYPSRFPSVPPATDTAKVNTALTAYIQADMASDEDTPAAQQDYDGAYAALTIPERVELKSLILDYLCGLQPATTGPVIGEESTRQQPQQQRQTPDERPANSAEAPTDDVDRASASDEETSTSKIPLPQPGQPLRVVWHVPEEQQAVLWTHDGVTYEAPLLVPPTDPKNPYRVDWPLTAWSRARPSNRTMDPIAPTVDVDRDDRRASLPRHGMPLLVCGDDVLIWKAQDGKVYTTPGGTSPLYWDSPGAEHGWVVHFTTFEEVHPYDFDWGDEHLLERPF